MTPPAEHEVLAAIDRLARLERLDLSGRMPPPAGEGEAPSALLKRAGSGAIGLIEAALPRATGTGRVALAIEIFSLDPERGRRAAEALVGDATPAVVNTCLVGYRTVGQWARSVAVQAPAAPAPAARPRRGWPVWALAALAAALLLWLALGRARP